MTGVSHSPRIPDFSAGSVLAWGSSCIKITIGARAVENNEEEACKCRWQVSGDNVNPAPAWQNLEAASGAPYKLLRNPYVYGPRVLEVDELRKYIGGRTERVACVKS